VSGERRNWFLQKTINDVAELAELPFVLAASSLIGNLMSLLKFTVEADIFTVYFHIIN
jgi:hypothetical protein